MEATRAPGAAEALGAALDALRMAANAAQGTDMLVSVTRRSVIATMDDLNAEHQRLTFAFQRLMERTAIGPGSPGPVR